MREKSGLTQSDLAEKSGLSLRTIQRLEKDEKPPKGHSLSVIAGVFELKPVELSNSYNLDFPADEDKHFTISIINLCALAFFILPFGNVIIPILIWRKNKSSAIVDAAARQIINFQILWSVALSISLCIAPFLPIGMFFGVPFIFVVLFVALIFNFIAVGKIAQSIRRKDYDFFDLPIKFL